MALFFDIRHFSALLSFIFLFICTGVSGSKFTFLNKCDYTVWPRILGSPKLDSSGFELPEGGSRSFQAPTGWSGRFWGRTGCTFDSSGSGYCATADCGSNLTECNGAGASPPATLAEFTLGSGGSLDFYDVSLVDGYNLPMLVEASGGSSGACATTGCVEDLNRKCPSELRVDGGGACKSACDAFGKAEYCCSGAYNSPALCKPSMYSLVFKSACPKSYSYAYDDASSTFTCGGADYTITFCPLTPSLKSSSNATPKGLNSDSTTANDPIETAAIATEWLAELATGDSRPSVQSSLYFCLHVVLVLAISIILRRDGSRAIKLEGPRKILTNFKVK